MRLYDFARLHSSKVIMSDKIAKALGLVEGSQVYTSMFRYERNGSTGYEVVASTFGPENYKQICQATFYMTDTPGSCAQVAKFLADRNIDILNSVSISMVGNVTMVWNMLVDLSYFGEVATLKDEFEGLKRQKSLTLANIDAMEIGVSNMSDRYTKGIAAQGSSVKVKSIRPKQKTASIIHHGALELPSDLVGNLEGVQDGALVMMVADTEDWVLSLSFLPQETKLAEFEVCIPDKPGAIFEITNALAKGNVNLLALYTHVLVFYERMTIRVVADVTRYPGGTMALVKDLAGKLSVLEGRFELLSMKEMKV
jgi:predicted amino acid-binding ACT domain protein